MIMDKHLFQVRSGGRKPAANELVSTGGQMTQNEPAGIVALYTQSQQLLAQPVCPVEVSASRMMARLPVGDLKKLRWGPQPRPQLSCSGEDLPGFRRPIAFDGLQRRPQAFQEYKLPQLTFGGVRQQHQLIQCLLELRGRFRHGGAGGRSLTGSAPVHH